MKIFDKLLDIMCFISKLIIAFVMFSVTLDVFLRYLFNRPLIWVIPFSEYSLVYVTFLGAAWLLREEGHVTMETFLEGRSTATRALFGFGSSILGIFVSFIFTWYGAQTTYEHFVKKIYESAVLELPIAPVLAIIPIGSFFLLIQFVRRALKSLRIWNNARRGKAVRPEWDEMTPSPGL